MIKSLFSLALFFVALLPATIAPGQTNSNQNVPFDAKAEREAAGDQPNDPGPLAKSLSPALQRKAIRAAIKKVADWQLKQAEGHYNIQWTFAALYDGLLATSKATGDRRYHDRILEVARENQWTLGPRFAHADDEAIGLTYLTFYAEDPGSKDRFTPTWEGMDKVLARPDDPKENLWWWCDALYMAPKVLAQLAIATGDRKYLSFMDHEWWLTSAALYDPNEHLYLRDNRFLTMHEANGQEIFWSRGTGRVLAGLAMVLQRLPESFRTVRNM